MPKWWLVSDEALRKVRGAIEYELQGSGEDCKCALCKRLKEVMHELTCGTHKTDAVPMDYQLRKGS